MALSFGDIALSIGAGVAEKDMAIRDAEFKQALDNFKEEKAHTKKLAESIKEAALAVIEKK